MTAIGYTLLLSYKGSFFDVGIGRVHTVEEIQINWGITVGASSARLQSKVVSGVYSFNIMCDVSMLNVMIGLGIELKTCLLTSLIL